MMNLSSLTIRHIPSKEEIEYIGSCKYGFQGECQLINKKCSGKNQSKQSCKFFVPDKRFYLTF